MEYPHTIVQLDRDVSTQAIRIESLIHYDYEGALPQEEEGKKSPTVMIKGVRMLFGYAKSMHHAIELINLATSDPSAYLDHLRTNHNED